jgi:hypothetical protein
MNCKRCNRHTEKETICLACKEELLLFYEATNDWNMALDLEVAQKSFFRYKNFGDEGIQDY